MSYSPSDFVDDVTATLAEEHTCDAEKLAQITRALRALCSHDDYFDANLDTNECPACGGSVA